MAKVGHELIGDRALVTGSTAGMGRAIALRLADEGCKHIAIHGRNEERLNKVAAELEAKGVDVFKARFDLADQEQAHQLVADVIKAFGGIDIVINNAGMTLNTLFHDVTDSYLDWMIKSNFSAGFMIAKDASKWMMDNGVQGVIMWNAAEAEYGGLPYQPVYSAVKAAMINLAKSIGLYLAPYGIRCVAVSPGFTDTNSMDNDGAEEAKHVRETLPKVMPMGRMATCEDAAAVFVFLATHDANYITGTNIVVDGAVSSGSVCVPWMEALTGRLTFGDAIGPKKHDDDSERAKLAEQFK